MHVNTRLTLALMAMTPFVGCTSAHSGRATLATQDKLHASHAAAQADLPPKQAAEVCMATAKELEQAGHGQEAIKLYERARQQNPKLTQIARHLAVLYQRNGEFDRAITEYQNALAAAPKDAALHNDLGYCYYEQSSFAAAETAIRRAIALNSKCERAWGNLGLVLGCLEKYDESYEAFTHVVSPAEARSNVGVLLVQHGKASEAKQAFEQALAAAPDLEQARVMLATLESTVVSGSEVETAQNQELSADDATSLVAP